MSTFFEKLSKTAKKTASTIGTKSAEMVSTGKLKLEIKQLESKIKEKKLEIGTAIYDAYAANEEPDLQVVGEMCGEVAAFENQIQELEQQIKSESEPAAVSSSPSPEPKICPGCGSAEKEGTSFCSQCGHKLDKSCTKCGESLKPGIKFCASCGTPVE